jgi:protein subunit release factor A
MTEKNVDPDPFPIPETDEELLAQCRVETFMAGGKGGQHQNRTESGVRLVHLPTGLVAQSREERSQFRNKRVALQRLRERLEESNYEAPPRIPTKVPRREREKRLKEKRHRSRRKEGRKPPPTDDGD